MTQSPAYAGPARFDIADIVRAHRAELEQNHGLSKGQKKVLTDIERCRTVVLGGHIELCDSCGYTHPAYNSCRNRHCPKCQALAQQQWIEKRSERLLDVGHFHVVFTLPSELRPLARFAPREVFNALFHGVSRALLELGQGRLHATLGATLVLHTWTRQLLFHPHVHAIVTAGGLAKSRSFHRSERRYLFPVKVMGQLLRGHVLHALGVAHAQGTFAGFAPFDDPAAFPSLVAKLAKMSWNVYAKAPFRKSKHVLSYLGRYTHRVGIGNSRLLDVTAKQVTFRTKGAATCTLAPVEFLHRLVQHVLPDRFHKIRHIGLYASGSSASLARARSALGMAAPSTRPQRPWAERLLELSGRDVRLCPACSAPLIRVPVRPLARGPPSP